MPSYIPISTLPFDTSTSPSELEEPLCTMLSIDQSGRLLNLIICRPPTESAVILMFSLLSGNTPFDSMQKSPPTYSLSEVFVKIKSVVLAFSGVPLSIIIPFWDTRKPPNERA